MSGITVRPFEEGDAAAIERGFVRAFGENRPEGTWAWKFPAEPGRFIMVAVDGDGEVVAHYAAVPVRLALDGRTILAGQVVDAFGLARSGLARRGVFTQTVDAFFDRLTGPGRLQLLFGFPGVRHLRLGLLGLGYGEPRPVHLWERPVAEAGPAPRSEPGREPEPGPRPVPGARRSEPGTGREPRPSRWRALRRLLRRAPVAVHGFDAGAVDALWRRSAGRYPVAAVRDAVRWRRRYRGAPAAGYRQVTVFAGRKPAAVGIFAAAGEELRWADLLWDGGDPAALAALDAEADGLARQLGALRHGLWLEGDREAAEVFAARGWSRREHPEGLRLTARSFDPAVDADAVADRLYFTLGDSDLV